MFRKIMWVNICMTWGGDIHLKKKGNQKAKKEIVVYPKNFLKVKLQSIKSRVIIQWKKVLTHTRSIND